MKSSFENQLRHNRLMEKIRVTFNSYLIKYQQIKEEL